MPLLELSRETKNPFPQTEVVRKSLIGIPQRCLPSLSEAEDMLLAEAGKIKSLIPTAAREVFDVSGAGDTVIASLTLGLVSGESFENAAQLANLAAGLVVGKVGTATTTPEKSFPFFELGERFSKSPFS